jgi:hypothetical protein
MVNPHERHLKLGPYCMSGASREDVDASAHLQVRMEHRPLLPRGASDRVAATSGCFRVRLEERGTLWDRQLLMDGDFGHGKIVRIGEAGYLHLTLSEHDKTKTGAIPRLYASEPESSFSDSSLASRIHVSSFVDAYYF